GIRDFHVTGVQTCALPICPWGGWRVAGADPDPLTGFHRACESLGVDRGTIGLELGYGQRIAMSQDDFKLLNQKLSGATFVDAGTDRKRVVQGRSGESAGGV